MTITNSLSSDFVRFIYLHPFHEEFKGFFFYTRSHRDNIQDLIKRIKQ